MTDNNHPITLPPELVEQWRTAPEYASALEKLTMVTMTDRRLQEIATQAARWGNHPGSPDRSGNLKAGLTRSPADEEVAELVAWLREEADDYDCIGETLASPKCRRAADLLERQAPQPISVSKRLPGPGDCDAEGRCWTWAIGTWRLSRINRSFHTHWLPSHALPQPS